MEIGDILIYILGGIFLLGGLLRKRKRRQPAQQEVAELETEPDFTGQGVQDFDDWLMGKTVAPQPIAVTPEKKTIKNQNADIFSSSRAKGKPAPRPKSQNFSDFSSNLTIRNDRNNTLNIELNTAEDARRAFIYSEIFQRKY